MQRLMRAAEIVVVEMTYYVSVGGKHEHEAARGVIPDFPVKHIIADLEAGVDRDFELALELARKSR